jgi:hypothetical protein
MTKPKKRAKAKASKPVKKPSLPPLDPLRQAQEACVLAQEGAEKLRKLCDMAREGLQVIQSAEFDNLTKMPVSAQDLRQLAAETLAAMIAFGGQRPSARTMVVHTRAGTADHSLAKNRGLDGADYDG